MRAHVMCATLTAAACGLAALAQRSPVGQTYKNLIQIGGGQNTFGAALPPGTGIAENANVVAGVGQVPGAPEAVASGAFAAPGAYVFHLENAFANALQAMNPPPVPPVAWPVQQATVVNLPAATLSFTVTLSPVHTGDLNCDGQVNFGDINPFVALLTNA